jgi:cytochrome c peroxidase
MLRISVKKLKPQGHRMMVLITVVFALCMRCKPHPAVVTEVQLGEALFFDPVLSRDSAISCASCHRPEFAFADSARFSLGSRKLNGNRNAPSVMNLADRNAYFWDGRAASLEEQALGPMENPVEMDHPVTLSVRRLIRSPYYRSAFASVYGRPPSKDLLASAIAAYERTLGSTDTPFDRYMSGADTNAISISSKRGLGLFNGKARCFDCHFGVDFTGLDRFKNIGLYNGKELKDEGRFTISGKVADLGAFKTPGLRNVAVTAPYMHNGMFRTLQEVIEFYNEPDKFVSVPLNRDSLLHKPLGLSKQEKADLLAFLETLTDDKFSKK